MNPNAEPPPPVRVLARGRPARLVWENELGGLTFEVDAGDGRFFVKWAPASTLPGTAPAGRGLDLAAEAERLRWAARYTPVPWPLDQGADESGAWLVTSAVPGTSAVTARWLAEPATAVRAIGEGLREPHETFPVRECPFSWMAGYRLSFARKRRAGGQRRPSERDERHRRLGVDQALELASRPARTGPGITACSGISAREHPAGRCGAARPGVLHREGPGRRPAGRAAARAQW